MARWAPSSCAEQASPPSRVSTSAPPPPSRGCAQPPAAWHVLPSQPQVPLAAPVSIHATLFETFETLFIGIARCAPRPELARLAALVLQGTAAFQSAAGSPGPRSVRLFSAALSSRPGRQGSLCAHGGIPVRAGTNDIASLSQARRCKRTLVRTAL